METAEANPACAGLSVTNSRDSRTGVENQAKKETIWRDRYSTRSMGGTCKTGSVNNDFLNNRFTQSLINTFANNLFLIKQFLL
jgi:hypothetical protein